MQFSKVTFTLQLHLINLYDLQMGHLNTSFVPGGDGGWEFEQPKRHKGWTIRKVRG